jgi:YNFM family putative membrane transporter
MNYIEIGSAAHRRASASMLLGSIVTFAVLYSPQPLIPLLMREYDLSPAAAGASVSVSTIALGVSLLVVTIVSAKWGRKATMSLSLVLTSLFAVASSFAHPYPLFLLFRLLEGISIAGFPPIAMAYLNEEFAPQAVGGVMGYYVAGTAIGGFAGRAIIGSLTDLFDWRIAMLALGVVSLLLSVWFWTALPAPRHSPPRSRVWRQWAAGTAATLRSPDLLYLFLTAFLLMGGYIAVLNYFGYPLTQAPYHVSQTAVGFLFVVNLIGTWSSIWFGKLADRYPRRLVIALGMAIFIVGAALTLSGYLLVKIAGIAAVAFGFFAGHSVASGWVGRIAGQGTKANASSFYLMFYYAGSSLVGWLGGLALERFGWTGLVAFICALLLLSVIFSMQVRGSKRAVEV